MCSVKNVPKYSGKFAWQKTAKRALFLVQIHVLAYEAIFLWILKKKFRTFFLNDTWKQLLSEFLLEEGPVIEHYISASKKSVKGRAKQPLHD